MDKTISFSISLFLVAVVIATVTSFGGDSNDFGEDYFNRKYQVVRPVTCFHITGYVSLF